MCMVCGSLGELTKLRAYIFQFWFQVLPVVEGRARDDCMSHTIVSQPEMFYSYNKNMF